MSKGAALPPQPLEDVVQPLTALLVRLELLTEMVDRGELAAGIDATRRVMAAARCPDVTRPPSGQ